MAINILHRLQVAVYMLLTLVHCAVNLQYLLNANPACRTRKVVYQITRDVAYPDPLPFYLRRPGFPRTWGDEAAWRACPAVVTCLYAEGNV